MLAGKRILLGVTGGIAAYKAAFLLREFQKAGAAVRVTMTPSATRFVGSETFASLSHHEVAVEVFSNNIASDSWAKHISWGEWADLVVIAPCTANSLSKIVHGQSDNMLTSTVLAARCPLLICPTMDGEMYDHTAVQRNLAKAGELGFHILEPESGYLASGLEGKGRLPEFESILKKSAEIIRKSRDEGPLSGKKVLVTAGPTREYIDPVRFISNPSSGKMGIAMAEAAYRLGGDVTLLHGPISVPLPEKTDNHPFTTARDLLDLCQKHSDADIVIMAAAVSDFRPAQSGDKKIKKEKAELNIALEANPDILQELGKNKKKGQILIGFAMETDNLEQNAASKLKKKNLDWICANSLSEIDAGFEADTNRIVLMNGTAQHEFKGTKSEVARSVLRTIFEASSN
jgi:phosphopantothenoylcysteine decarboxylase/phosphopantothenate--cysteine ligase